MITQSLLKEYLDYNPITGLFTWKIAKGARANIGDLAGHKNKDGYIRIIIDKKGYKAHRLAWFYVHGKWPTLLIDHINRIRDDNRICNLREASAELNAQNRKKRINKNTTGTRYNKSRKKWHAVFYVGCNYKTQEEAIKEYLIAKKLYEDYKKINSN
jgi:hypothetical protein